MQDTVEIRWHIEARCLDTLHDKADPTPVGATLLSDIEILHKWSANEGQRRPGTP